MVANTFGNNKHAAVRGGAIVYITSRNAGTNCIFFDFLQCILSRMVRDTESMEHNPVFLLRKQILCKSHCFCLTIRILVRDIYLRFQ